MDGGRSEGNAGPADHFNQWSVERVSEVSCPGGATTALPSTKMAKTGNLVSGHIERRAGCALIDGSFSDMLHCFPIHRVTSVRFFGGVTVINGQSIENRPFVAVLFYTLANRERFSQEVWLNQEGKRETPTGWQDALYHEIQTLTSSCTPYRIYMLY